MAVPKSLVIVESPAKARTIAAFLGDDFIVESSIGHIRDLPRNADEVPERYKGSAAGRLGIDVDDHFSPIYVIPASKRKVVATLKAAMKQADELYLATDEDREGEAISWHVLEVLKPKIPVKRMVFHEITREAIHAAMENSRDLDMKLVEAQEGRRVLDRLVGYEVSPVLWKKVMPRLSAGRVQSVATRLVVERERARMAFRAGEYWDLEADLVAKGVVFAGTLIELDGKRVPNGKDFDAATGRLASPADFVQLDESAATGLAERLRDAAFVVRSSESSAWKQSPPAPFITSTLQQEAGHKLRFGSARAMAVAQRLYERGFITYMRTDSTNLSEQAVSAARTRIRELYGNEYLPEAPRTYRRKVKNAQEAHEAIRPAGDRMRTPDEVKAELDGDERRLYDLIWKRTIACQMTDSRGRRVALRIGATSTAGEAATLASSGRTIEFPGYLRAYVEGADDPDAELGDRESPIPPVSQGDGVDCRDLSPSGHKTQPPARFSEASLVKELEQRGIGRPSTYAAVIQTIQDRGYVWKKATAMVPTWVAFATIQLLERHFEQLVDYGFTATMEEALDVIATGQAATEKWLDGFYFGNGTPGLKQLVGDEVVAQIDAREMNTVPLGLDAEGVEILVRVGRYGPYLQRMEERASLPEDLPPDELTIDMALELLARGRDDGRVLGTDPASGLRVIARDGRYGPYVQLGEHETDQVPADDGSSESVETVAKPKGRSAAKKQEKLKTASLFKTMTLEAITLEQALELLSLPRVVGVDAQGVEVAAQNGRYGPYLKKGTDTRSLESEDLIFSITMEQCETLFAQPKPRGRQAKPPLAELGPHPDSGANVRVLEGRFGPYVTDGSINASLPRGVTPETYTMDEAVALLRARAERGPVTPRKTTKRTAKKATAKKTTAKKATAKKATAKKATAKKTTATKATAKKATAKKATGSASTSGDYDLPDDV